MLGVRERLLQAMPDLIPGTLILRFFLTPDDVSGGWIAGDYLVVLDDWIRVDLLDAYDGDIGHSVYLSSFDKIVIDFAAAKYDAAHFFRIDATSIGNDQLK